MMGRGKVLDDFADDRWETRRTRTPTYSRGERGKPQQRGDNVRYVCLEDAEDESARKHLEMTLRQSEEISRLRAANAALERERDELRQLIAQFKAQIKPSSELGTPRPAADTVSVEAFAQNNNLAYRTALRYLLGQCRSACVQRPDGSRAYIDVREAGSKLAHYRVYPDAQIIYQERPKA